MLSYIYNSDKSVQLRFPIELFSGNCHSAQAYAEATYSWEQCKPKYLFHLRFRTIYERIFTQFSYLQILHKN